jgi:hypothetical protein
MTHCENPLWAMMTYVGGFRERYAIQIAELSFFEVHNAKEPVRPLP